MNSYFKPRDFSKAMKVRRHNVVIIPIAML